MPRVAAARIRPAPAGEVPGDDGAFARAVGEKAPLSSRPSVADARALVRTDTLAAPSPPAPPPPPAPLREPEADAQDMSSTPVPDPDELVLAHDPVGKHYRLMAYADFAPLQAMTPTLIYRLASADAVTVPMVPAAAYKGPLVNPVTPHRGAPDLVLLFNNWVVSQDQLRHLDRSTLVRLANAIGYFPHSDTAPGVIADQIRERVLANKTKSVSSRRSAVAEPSSAPSERAFDKYQAMSSVDKTLRSLAEHLDDPLIRAFLDNLGPAVAALLSATEGAGGGAGAGYRG